MAANSRSTVERAGDREKSLETALLQIERQFGKGSVMRLGEETRVPVEVIPTGSIALDVALGLGGLPRGRIVEIYGPESSGKTTVALHAVANAQKAGGIAAFIDAEHALDPEYAKKLGVRHRRAAGFPARHRRAGAGDRGHAHQVRRHRHRRHRLGRRAGAQGGDRGRDGGQPRRAPGPAHVPGPPQDHRRAEPDQDHRDLHQPAPGKGRRHVRQPGDDQRRQGAQVLRLGPAGRAPDRDAQGRHRRGRQQDPRQGREEQDVARRSRWPNSTSSTASGSAAKAA